MKKRLHYSKSDTAFNIGLYTIASIILILVAYPLWFILISSVSDPNDVAMGRVWFWPSNFTLLGYQEVFKRSSIWVAYRNTVMYVIAGTGIGLAVNLSAAYALSRRDLIGRRIITLYFIFTMFFNGGLIPTYLTIQQFGLYNTFWVMVLPFSVATYNIIVARTFFSTSLPDGLWDAAQIDGCGNLRFYFTMALPLSKAVIAVLGLWTAVGHWNAYFNALIYLKDESKYPLQLVLRAILIVLQGPTDTGYDEAARLARKIADMLKYSAIVVSTVPIMCMYPFVQKYFNQGVMIGALKE
ncbi:MAG: carbohydrate ABC transporter permease [Oscillospiraceae bacterium]|nr:carbohydrate ABC transporter permease [Oscillospiraceae bacterium]